MTTTPVRIEPAPVPRPAVGGRWSGRAGFSLIELLVVVMIILIILGVGIAVMNAVENNAKVSATRQTLKACTAIANEYLAQTGNVINHDQPIAGNTFNYDWTTPKSYNRHLTRWLQPVLWGNPNPYTGPTPSGTPYRKPVWAPFDAEVIGDGPVWYNASYDNVSGNYSWAWWRDPHPPSSPPTYTQYYYNNITIYCDAYKSIQRFVWAAMQNPVTNDMLMALGPRTLMEKNMWSLGIATAQPSAKGAGFLCIVDAWDKPLQYRAFSNGGEKDGSGDIAPLSPYEPPSGSPSYDPTQGATAPSYSTTVANYNYWPALPACNTPFFASAGRDGYFGFHYPDGEYNADDAYGYNIYYLRDGTALTTAQMQTYQQDNLYSYEVK